MRMYHLCTGVRKVYNNFRLIKSQNFATLNLSLFLLLSIIPWITFIFIKKMKVEITIKICSKNNISSWIMQYNNLIVAFNKFIVALILKNFQLLYNKYKNLMIN